MSNIKRPSFTDRDVQHPNRVTLLPSEGSAVTYDVVPAPGTVTQEGTPVDSDLMNEMADYSELGYKNKLYVSANGHADDVFYETGEPSTVNLYGQTRQNLWKNPSGTSNGVTVTSNEDGSVTLSGAATSNATIAAPGLVYTLAAGRTYFIDSGGLYSAGVSILVNSYSDEGVITPRPWDGNSDKGVFTLQGNSIYCSFFFYVKSGTSVSGTYHVMLREATEAEIAAAQQTASTLQEGGTADIPQDHPVTLPAYPIADSGEFDWCPPGLTSVSELSLNVSGKNMLSPNSSSDGKTTLLNSGVSVSQDNMRFSFSGTATGSGGRTTPFAWISIAPGTYSFSFDTNVDTGTNLIVYINDMSNSVLYSMYGNKSMQIDLSEKLVGYIGFNVVTGVDYNGVEGTVQLESGTGETAYEPYAGSSTPIDLQGNVLSSLPDGTRDVLTVDANGARSIDKNVLSITLNGSENWGSSNIGANTYVLNIPGAYFTSENNAWCDTLPILSQDDGYAGKYGIRVGITTGGVPDVWIMNTGKTLSEFKSWLSQNPVTVICGAVRQTIELDSIDPVIPPSTTTNMWASANSTLTPELDFTYDKRLSLGSNTTFGFVKGDGTTIDVINGIIQLAGDVISGIWDKVKPYADATYALINHTHTASQLPKATTSALGLVKPDGSTLSIDGNGTLSVAGGGSGYTLPPATATTLGGIKVGDNLTVESDGTLNATGGGGSIPNPLPIAQGGTGAQTAAAAEYNILGSPNASSNAIGDSDKLAVVYASPSASNGVLYTQTASKLWTYIKSKADSVYRAAAAKIPWADLEDVPTSFPPSEHTHSANDITSGTLPIARGGTGGATAAAALTNLGVKGTTSGNVTEHYKLGKLHFMRITGTVSSLANNQTTVGPFNLGFNMPAQPRGANTASFTQGTLLSRYTSNAKATVNTLSYTSRSSISINLFAQQAISTSVTYDVWLAVSEA